LRHDLDSDGPERLVASSVTVERFVFLTAYIMRKLKEADALTLDVTTSKWPVSKFLCVAPPPHRKWFAVSEDAGKSWRQPLENHYDLRRPNRERLRFPRICDYLVHHFAFDVRYDRQADQIEIFFNSDQTTDRLFLIALPVYVELVQEVARDEVRWVDMSRAERRVVQRRRRPAVE
jgi:hypothetical protein